MTDVVVQTQLGYNVIEPHETFQGKTYADWIEDWTRWFCLPNLDQNNSGSVVFVRGMSLSAVDNYRGEGVINVGNDSLEISTNQRVLLPIITATAVAEAGESSQSLYQLVRSDIDNGEDPPQQGHVRIDNRDFAVALDGYRFETRVFQLYIPSAPYGQSLADYVVPPIRTRDTNLPCVTAGYFVLLDMTEVRGYDIFSAVFGNRDQNGLYKASLLYHIQVEAERGRMPGRQLAQPISTQLSVNFRAALRTKLRNGEIDTAEYRRLVRLLP